MPARFDAPAGLSRTARFPSPCRGECCAAVWRQVGESLIVHRQWRRRDRRGRGRREERVVAVDISAHAVPDAPG